MLILTTAELVNAVLLLIWLIFTTVVGASVAFAFSWIVWIGALLGFFVGIIIAAGDGESLCDIVEDMYD